MKIRLIILAIFTVIYISPVVYAQKNASYIVLSHSDTLYGKIKTDVSGHVKFKMGDNGEKIKYRPSELIGYYNGKKDKVFITIDPKDDNHGP